jgi:RHS repeat-associated protein
MRRVLSLLVCLFCLLPSASWAEGLDFGTLKATPLSVTGITLKDKESVPIMFGESAVLEATTFPKGLAVTWNIKPDRDSKALVSHAGSGSSVTITAAEDSGSGWVVVEASVAGSAPLSAKIYVGCDPCSNGVCTIPGSGTVNIGSVDIRISLGRGEQGMSAGDLFISADEPSPELFTPASLDISTLSELVSPIYVDGTLRQIDTPQTLVVVEPDTALAYEILFFHRRDVTENDDGLYEVKPFAEPISAWRIENAGGSADTIDEILVTEFRSGAEKRYIYTYTPEDHTWSLLSGNGLKRETRSEYEDAAGNRVERTTIAGSDDIPVSVVERTYRTFPWGEELISEIQDPNGIRLTTEYRYNETGGDGYSKPALRLDPDGSWTRYAYDASGRRLKTVTPWLDAPSTAREDEARVVLNDYTPLPGDSDLDRDRQRPRTVTTLITGIIAAKEFLHISVNGAGERVEISERCTRQDCVYRDEDNLRTIRTYYPEDDTIAAAKLKSRRSPDGTHTLYSYERGTFTPSPDPAKAVFTPGEGTGVRTTVINATVEHPDGIPFRTTKETAITDWLGNEVMQERFVRTDSGYERISWTYTSSNSLGRVVETLHANRTRSENDWSCCGKISDTDTNGSTTRYGYDDLQRLTVEINEATGLTSQYHYDAMDRRINSVQYNGDLSRTTTSRYDTAGRLMETTDPAGLTTSYTYTERTTRVLHPDGGEETMHNHIDGALHSVTGSAVVARHYRHGINPDGSQWTTMHLAQPDSPRWEKTTRDLLGRIVSTEKPGYLAPQISRTHYNTRGQLVRTSVTGRPATIFVYDELGNQIRFGLDTDTNGLLEPASRDRITETINRYQKIDTGWWHTTTTSVYAAAGSAVPTVIGIDRDRLTGWRDRLISQRVSTDIHGSDTVSTETLNRRERLRTTTVTGPDSRSPAQQVYRDTRLISSRSTTGVSRRYAYDPLGRPIAVIDERTGATRTSYDEQHRISATIDPAGNSTSYRYDELSGRKIADINPHGRATRYAYNRRGQLTRIWGSATYPVQYEYNDFGEQVAMQTYRTERGWDRPDWPESADGDTTTWVFQQSTGLLLATHDARGLGASYTYDEANRLHTRTWARGIVTSYRYEPTGEHAAIGYSDDTPGLVFTYDRLGRKKTVSDVLGTRSYEYDDDHLQLIGEQQHGPVVATIKRRYDNLGRPAGISLDDEYAVDYRYDQTGRFAALDWSVNSHRDSTTYDYLADSDLLAGYRSGTITVSYAYEAQRDLKTELTNTSHDHELSRYEYHYDRLGRRINVTTTGSAFPTPAFALYGYNDRNELTTAARYAGDELTDQSAPLPERERFYDYDPIGNRRKAVEGRSRYDYRTNPLNQYETITAAPDPSQTLELFYDQDGNLTEMKTAAAGTRYVFNGENRLIIVEPTEPQPGDSRLSFSYDYRGRRVLKTVSSFTDNSWHQTGQTGFIYDDWNLIAEVNLDDDTAVQYVWGLDLSNTLQGAGGIGGLLLRVDDDQQHYLYDANGNVGQLVDGEGTLVAAYEYDVYGNQVQVAGSNAAENPFRFSTKYYDALSGLYYYGYRYYSPELGRWVNQDPLGEEGGANLYGFVDNRATGLVDRLGLAVYVAYRSMANVLSFAWDLGHFAGHVYLVFDEEFEEGGDTCCWEQMLKELNVTFNSPYTFSYHPEKVVNPKSTLNRAGVLVTDGSAVDINNFKYDIKPYLAGETDKWMITNNPCLQAAIFKKAYNSGEKHNACGTCGDEYGSYSGSYKNCGGWAKYIIEKAGGHWSDELSRKINAGAGVDGPMQIPGAAFYGVTRAATEIEGIQVENSDGTTTYGVGWNIPF